MHTTRQCILPNGVRLKLRHAAHLKRTAAALRVNAGSHDAPARWPGLAHFLEHLFFLGTAQYPAQDNLMRYVQAAGGQVNARTSARTTDFFFETPPSAFQGGLQRLCNMLATPDLSVERQYSEREVIHAEFIAWSRNRQAQQQFAWLQTVPANHPLRAFQAGNRYTLALKNPAFQQALTEFYQRFYQGGQIVLSLCGPQSLDTLEHLGTHAAAELAAGYYVEQTPPPALPIKQHGLVFSHDHLPAGAEPALALLLAYLTDNYTGSWLATLPQYGALPRCQAQKLYGFAGQLLWNIDLTLEPAADFERIHNSLHGWFGFMRQQNLNTLNAQFAQWQQRRALNASAIELAQRDSANEPFTALNSQALNALNALLGQLPHDDAGQWQLPPVDPLLLNTLPNITPAPSPPALRVSSTLPATGQYAVLYLRGLVPSGLENANALLETALKPLQLRCERAAVQLQGSITGTYWQVRISGPQAAVIRALEQALTQLRTFSAANSLHAQAPALIPIQALLKQLPSALHTASSTQPRLQADSPNTQWLTSHWFGLATGFDEPAIAVLSGVLPRDTNKTCTPPAPPMWQGPRWQYQPDHSREHALLLFFPLPAHVQASGRVLAQHLQGPVYQRLRVELQVGYAVFSAFRCVEGLGGLLVGVQSPHMSAVEILVHLRALLSQGVTLSPATRQTLVEQFDPALMPDDDVAELDWQMHLAHSTVSLADLQRAIRNVQQADLNALLAGLLAPDATYLCLSNTLAVGSF